MEVEEPVNWDVVELNIETVPKPENPPTDFLRSAALIGTEGLVVYLLQNAL